MIHVPSMIYGIIIFCILVGVMLSAFILLSHFKKKKLKAESNLLELVFLKGRAEDVYDNIDLFLFNSDSKLVANVLVQFSDENDYIITRDYESLLSGQCILVKQFVSDTPKWKSATIRYEDCYSNMHKYSQELIYDSFSESSVGTDDAIQQAQENEQLHVGSL